ncbi:hypothetical protein [Streptomyces palmae]|uniref:Uncharacterized protein n=1 Tax=Streptomyces palmae TaxID=1701085 RepID=A0A4Z0GUT9_9ACTN|nr:hypothetical protein [Streptomyces palmae]TGB00065.1 hypothetical protein E4099_22105 [Streptomyces palmae]
MTRAKQALVAAAFTAALTAAAASPALADSHATFKPQDGHVSSYILSDGHASVIEAHGQLGDSVATPQDGHAS